MVNYIIICIVSLAWGFALACLIFSFFLPKSNDIGNSIGVAEDFKLDVSFDTCKDLELKALETSEVYYFCAGHCVNIDSGIEEPDPDKLVERMLKKQFELEDITSTYVDG